MGIYYDMILEDKTSDKAKAIAKSRAGISGYFNNLGQLGKDIKMLSKRPKGDPNKDGNLIDLTISVKMLILLLTS